MAQRSDLGKASDSDEELSIRMNTPTYINHSWTEGPNTRGFGAQQNGLKVGVLLSIVKYGGDHAFLYPCCSL